MLCEQRADDRLVGYERNRIGYVTVRLTASILLDFIFSKLPWPGFRKASNPVYERNGICYEWNKNRFLPRDFQIHADDVI